MRLIETISKEIATAMKDGNKERLEALKLIKSELQKAEKTGKAYDDAKVMLGMVSQYKASIAEFEKAGRDDLKEQYQLQLSIVQEFAPREVTTEEVESFTKGTIVRILAAKPEGYKLSMRDMKEVMTAVKGEMPSADGGLVAKIFKNTIEKG